MIFALAMLLAASQPARAQLVFGVSFDFPADAVSAMAPIFEQLQTLRDEAVSVVKKSITQIKAAIPSYFGKPQTVVGKVPAKKVAENSSVDIYDAAAVQAAVKELFLQYPSLEPRVKAAYEQQAQNFYYDTLIEMTMSANVLENNFTNMRANIQKIEEELSDPENKSDSKSESKSGGEGGNETGPTEDENGNYYNLYLASREFNKVLNVTEEVVAMYAQYYSARAIYKQTVLPAPYNPKESKGSKAAGKKTSAIMFNQTLAFAQFTANDALLVQSKAAEAAANAEPETAEVVAESDADSELISVKKPEIAAPLQASRAQLKALVTLSDAEKELNQALDVHNAIQMLPTYRNMFRQYELFKQLRQKASEAVAASDKCVLGYLGRRYKKPELVWYGGEKEPEDPTDYDSRKGLSAWAISAYQVANNFKTAGLDVDSFVPVTDTLEVDSDNPLDTEKAEAESNTKNSKNTSQNLASPGDSQEFSDTVREVEMLNWQIGAEAAKLLAADQYSEHPVYGKAEHPYPVWKDQKNFYNLYINEKYNNMIEYIRKADLNAMALKIARILSEDVSGSKSKRRIYNSYINELEKMLETTSTRDSKVSAAQRKRLAGLRSSEVGKAKGFNPNLTDLQDQLKEVSRRFETDINVSEISKEFKTGDKTNTADEKGKTGSAADSDDNDDAEEKDTNYFNELGKLRKIAKTNDDKVSIVQREKAKALRTLEAAKARELKPYLANKQTLQNQMNELGEKIKTGSNAVLDADSAVKEAEAAIEQSQQELQEMKNRQVDATSTLYGTAAATLDKNKQKAEEKRTLVAQLQEEVAADKKELEALTARLNALDEKIMRIEQSYILKVGALDREYAAKIDSAVRNVGSSVNLLSLLNSNYMTTTGFRNIISQAVGLTEDARNEAIELIKQAQKDILNMGDALYEPQNHSKVVARHQKLIKDLKSLSRKNLAKKVASLMLHNGQASIVSLLAATFQQPVTSMCNEVNCNKADTEYFVGYPAKARDFSAPKAPLVERYPPVHDIVHFDYDDYKNLRDKSSDLNYGVAAAFAEYGQELPSIWQMVLRGNPFVEKSFNLGALLRNRGGEDVAFMRGVRYPCILDRKYIVDVSSGKKAEYKITKEYRSDIPVCRDVRVVDLGIMFKVYDLESYDDESDSYVKGNGHELEKMQQTNASELGLFLGYSSDAYFNDAPRVAFARIAEMNEATEDDGNFKYTLRDTLYNKAMFKDNQIGNFVHFVDKEHTVRKNVEEMAVSIEDARNSIIELLSANGFTVNPNFNLANEADYSYIRSKLDARKNSLVGSAAQKIAGIDNNDDVIKERYDKLNNIRAALVQDADELISLNNRTVAGSPLTEEILTEKANQKVIEETQKAGEKSILKEINHYEVPLCVVY